MTDFVIPPPALATLAVEGAAARFPLARVFCIGRNYRWTGNSSAAGAKQPEPDAAEAREAPTFFMKPADAVVPAAGEIRFPPLTQEFCHEIELVVAIGRGGADIPVDSAMEHVWGYAAGLDLTRRDLQMQAKQVGGPWEPAKAFDASAPATPLVPASALRDPGRGAVWLQVNGVDRQRADLADLIWSVPELISFVSSLVVLKAGDLIFTGTPAGVGPLQPGDELVAGVAGVGEIRMTVGAR